MVIQALYFSQTFLFLVSFRAMIQTESKNDEQCELSTPMAAAHWFYLTIHGSFLSHSPVVDQKDSRKVTFVSYRLIFTTEKYKLLFAYSFLFVIYQLRPYLSSGMFQQWASVRHHALLRSISRFFFFDFFYFNPILWLD